MLKSYLLDLVLSTSGDTARKCLKRTSWNSFFSTSGAKARKCLNRSPGAYFVDFGSQGQKVLKSSLLEPILSISGAKARKCLNRTSWSSFCRLRKPRPESAQIEPPGTNFIDFWSQGQKMLQSDLLGPNTHQSHA